MLRCSFNSSRQLTERENELVCKYLNAISGVLGGIEIELYEDHSLLADEEPQSFEPLGDK